MESSDQNARFEEPQHQYQRRRRSRRSSTQLSSVHAQPSDSQSASAANTAGAVLGSATNTSISGGQFTAAANVVNRNMTINISEGVIPQAHTENRSGRSHNRRRGPRGPRAPRRPQLSPTEPAQRSNEIYERHLRLKKRGHPLWIPQPNMVLSIPYRAQGVRVGDVGLFTENGGFDFLFNVCVPRDDPINPQELPNNFHPIFPFVNPTDIRKFAEFSPSSYLASSAVAESRTADQSSGLTFESSATEGAILTMPEGAYSEDLSNFSRFGQYIAIHAEDWYKFVNGPRGRQTQNGDLRVVVGSDKTTSWGMATFANSTLSQNSKFRLNFSAEQPLHWNVWEHSGVAEARVGPGRDENQELGETNSNRLRNQCLFLRTLNVMLSKNAWEENFPQTVVVTDQNDFHPGIQDQSTHFSPGSRGGHTHGQLSPSHSSQNLRFRNHSSTAVTGSICTLAYPELTDDEETRGQTSSNMSSDSSGYEEIQCNSTSTPNVILTRSPSSNDVLHPSTIINQYLLEQNPNARVAVTHDRDWSNITSTDLDSSQMPLVVLSRNDVVFDKDTGLVFLELKEKNQNGMLAKKANLKRLIKSIKDGTLTLDQYLFGFQGDHSLRLRDLCTALRLGSTNQPISESSFLIGHPERPLSLDELLEICNGNLEGAAKRQPILSLRVELNLLPLTQHTDRSSCFLRLGDALSRRFSQWGQRDDLEEAMWCYEEALSLLPNSHYQYLETLLGLCSTIYQRFCLLGHADDLESLLRNLKLEQDVLNQRRSLLILVEAQLKKLHLDPGCIEVPESQDIKRENKIDCLDRIRDDLAIPGLTHSVRDSDHLRDVPRMHFNIQQLAPSNEFTQPLFPYEEEIRRHRPLPRVPHVVNYQNLPPPLCPRLPSLTPPSPATGPFPYIPDLLIPRKYPLLSPLKRSDHVANRLSLAPPDPPAYRSIYSSHKDSHIPVPTTRLDSTFTQRDNQYTSFQHASASASNLPAQLATVLISPISTGKKSRLPFRSAKKLLNYFSASSSHSSHESFRDSTFLSGLSSPSPSIPMSDGTWLPPPPNPPLIFYIPGSRSVARPRTFEIAPVSLIVPTPIQSNNRDSWPKKGALELSQNYERKLASSVPKTPPEIVFPTARSRAQPKISSKLRSSKRSTYSSKSGDDNQESSRFIKTLFKRKIKAKAPNISPISAMYTTISNSMASILEIPASKGKQTSADSNHESTSAGPQERKGKMKSRRGSYPLDPYNSVLLDNDRHTGELLSRLNPTGSPTFHNYGTVPPSSVLDLGCGQGHWVLEAAVAWKAYGTHVTGYDMVDISKSLLSWATEEGVQDNIRFVRGNFLRQQLPFSSNTFDLVRMSCLALCITSGSWSFILQEVCRVLMVGGRLEFIDDQIFFPYGKVSSLMDDDTNSVVETVGPELDFVLPPNASTFSVCGDVANPGLGSTVSHRNSDDNFGIDDDSGLDDDSGALHDHEDLVTVKLSTIPPRTKSSIIIDREAWDRSISISEDLEALFEYMLLDAFDIYKDPSKFILPLMQRVFGQARQIKTMNLVLAPGNSTAKSEHSFQEGLSHYPGLISWPSTFIPMDHTEAEIHASKHLRTLLSCKNFLIQHAIEVAEDESVDDELISKALWEYESFLGHRFNPPVPSNEHPDQEESNKTSIRSSIEESNEAMWEIQSESRQQYAWQAGRPPNTFDTQRGAIIRMPSPPVASLPAPGSSVTPNELTHVRTFRVYEAVKLDNLNLR